MFIERLKLFQFRNLKSGEYRFTAPVSFVIGQNGQGKSNLIEAISFLSSGRSFRTSSTKDLISWESSACSVFGGIRGRFGDLDLGLSFESGRRIGYRNGERVKSLNDYIGEFVTVSFAPADLALVQGSPSERRQFMDKHIVDLSPPLFATLATYARALHHRHSLFKSGERRYAHYQPFDSIIIENGIALTAAKKRFVEAINPKANAYYQKLSHSQDGELVLKLVSNISDIDASEYAKRLGDNFDRDFFSQSTRTGPHRDDLAISLGDREARSFASQGQVRSVVLSLKLATLDMVEEMRGEPPVLLLDDIESELDKTRMEQLLRILFSRQRQVILTGTDLESRSLFESHEFEVFSIDNGIVNYLN